jgi:branched-chain amino acid transport system substrate-binding protein
MTDPTGLSPSAPSAETATTTPGLSRRGLLRTAGAGAAVLGGGAVLDACSSGIKGTSSSSSSTGTIKIAWIHPITGPEAGFGYPDAWVHSKIMATSQFKNGIKIGNKTYAVEYTSYDTQSDDTKAGDLAKQAITDGADLLFASSTPETVNGVAVQANALGVPLICSNCPWESYYGALGGNIKAPTLKPKYSVLYFLGAEHLALCFIPMWNRIGKKYGNNHLVSALFPSDADGDAFRAVFPAILPGAGYDIKMSTAYPDGTTNYTSIISYFKSTGADFFTCVPEPSDFPTYWKQSIQQGYKPKLATVAKVLLFPTDAYAMGSEAYNIATDAWWVPSLPWTSSLTGETCSELAADYTAAGLGQPNANISNYTLWEIAYKALTSVSDPHDHEELAAALYQVDLPEAIAGPVNFASTNTKTNPAPGVAITPPVGIQWQKDPSGTYPLISQVVDNTLQPDAKITADLLPTNA